MAIEVGSQAPDFVLKTKTSEGLKEIKLSDNFGNKNTVLLFFPAAFTGVCTSELCDVSNGMSVYNEMDAKVYGISPDSPFAQEAWSNQAGISVRLLSDYARTVSAAYGVGLEDFAGLGPGNKRAVFVIDKKGIVRYVEETPALGDLPNFEAVRAAVSSPK